MAEWSGWGVSSLSLAIPSTAVMTGCVPLPSHRLVGELPHPIELLLHLVRVVRLNMHINIFFSSKLFLRSHPQRANIPGDVSQRDAPCSWTEAQHTIRAPIFPFPHRRLRADAEGRSSDHIFCSDVGC